MKRRVIFAVVLAMILMVIGCAALATEKTTRQDGAFVKVSYNCYDEAGNNHSPSVTITKVEVNKTSANSATVNVYYKTSCNHDSSHDKDKTGNPVTLYRLARNYCTDGMDNFWMATENYQDSGAKRTTSYVYAEIERGSHTWANGKCKNCPAVCDHSGNTNPPTCTESAACSICGKTLEALGHDEKTIDRLEPTCTEAGHTEGRYCDRCKEVFVESTVLNALEHDYKTIDRLEPTCTEAGHTEGRYCDRCKEVFVESTVLEVLGHDYKTIERLEPTCTEAGHTERRYCDRCKEVFVESTVLNALGHDPITDPSVDPTCTETGLTAGEHCKVCETILIEQQIIPAKGHDYSAKKVEPTCTEGGYTKHTCAVCGDSYKDQKKAKLGHYYGLWHDNGDVTHTASCVRKGCEHQATVECHMFEYALTNAAEEEAATIEFCPVCGFCKELDAMAAVEGAKLVSGKLSKGEIIVREALLPEGGRLMTIAFEYAGKLVQPAERMEIALPTVLAEGEAFTLLNPDGTETAVECVSDAETTRVILEYPEEIDAEQVDPETNLVRLLRAVPAIQ